MFGLGVGAYSHVVRQLVLTCLCKSTARGVLGLVNMQIEYLFDPSPPPLLLPTSLPVTTLCLPLALPPPSPSQASTASLRSQSTRPAIVGVTSLTRLTEISNQIQCCIVLKQA